MAKAIIPNSGAWSTLAALLNGNFNELYAAKAHGLYTYADLTTQTTPFTVPGTSVYTDVPNDAQGAGTDESYGIGGVTGVYDGVTNLFDFSGWELGDLVLITANFTVTTTAANQAGNIQLLAGIGSASEAGVPLLQQSIKTAGTYTFNATGTLPLNNTDFLNNPAKLQMSSDSSASVVVNSWTVSIQKRNVIPGG